MGCMDDASTPTSTPESRAAERRLRIVGHRAQSFEAAERWDLDFWQSCTPQERLSAFADLRRDVELVRAARSAADDGRRG